MPPSELSEKYAFDPVRYYPDDIGKCISNNLLCIELFFSAKGLNEEEVVNRKANPEVFKLPEDFEDKARNMWQEILSRLLKEEGKEGGSSPTARLFDFKKDEKSNKFILFFQRAEYWQSHVTNFHLDWKGWGYHLREKVTPDHRIQPLNDSIYRANHLGRNCTMLTRDEKLILQKRSELVAVSPELIGLSAEGAMSWGDNDSGDAPSPFIGMFREILEELGLTRDEIAFFRLLSIYRNLYWGGKPQAVFLARTNKTWYEVNQTFRNGPRGHKETSYLELLNNDKQEISELLNRANLAFTTKMGLHYYLKYCSNERCSFSADTCPLCLEGYLVKRQARNGGYFFGCVNYPRCKYRQRSNSSRQNAL